MSASNTELAVITPMRLVELAVSQNFDIEKLSKVMDLYDRWEMNKAKVEFREAMSEFKRNPPDIIKKRVAEIKAKETHKVVGSYNFADLDDYSEPISAGLAAVGITHRFKHTQTNGGISVTCILSKGIYSEEGDPLSSPPDISGAKNAIQSIGSTLSYLERYTLCAATGMSAGMPDNDGAGNGVVLTDELQDLLDIIKGSATKVELQAAFSEAYKTAKDTKTKAIYIDAYEARKKEL